MKYYIKYITQMKLTTLFHLLKIVGVSLLAFLAPIKGLLIIISLMCLLDTLYALYAANKKREPITWSKFKTVFFKTSFYLTLVIVIYLFDIYVVGMAIMGFTEPFAKGMTILLSWREIKSMDNTSQKLGNKPFEDIINDMLDTFKKIKTKFEGLFKKDKKDE